MNTSSNSERELTIFFHLIPSEESKSRLFLLSGRGELHDSPTVSMPYWLFSYLLDTLRWIPTKFAPMDRMPFERPAIAAEGAIAARNLFSGWRQVFSSAAGNVSLTVGAGFPAEKMTVPRDDLVSCMESLEAFTLEIESGQKFIYLSDSLDHRAKISTMAELVTSPVLPIRSVESRKAV